MDYAQREVYNFLFYIGDRLEFEISDVTGYSIKHYNNGENIISISHALFNDSLLQKILNGKYDNVKFEVYAYTLVRDVMDFDIDKNMLMYLKNVDILKYNIVHKNGETAKPEIVLVSYSDSKEDVVSVEIKRRTEWI